VSAATWRIPLALAVFLAVAGVWHLLSREAPADCHLANLRIDESSGLARSRRSDGVFWTHNDSGDGPFLYAFNRRGEDLGTFRVARADHVDWEDLAAFNLDGRHLLLIGDTGDNARQRPHGTLYLVEEPAVPASGTAEATLLRTIRFRFQDGPEDGEGVAVDPTSRTVLIATRYHEPRCDVYALPLLDNEPAEPLVARRIARLPIDVGNAMDISPDGRRAVIGTYGDAYEFTRRKGETWAEAFSRPPRVLAMPRRRKGEAVAYGADAETLHLTSEGSPCRLWTVRRAEAAERGN
jgi:hypothetical protein